MTQSARSAPATPEEASAVLETADRLYTSGEVEAALDRLGGALADRVGDRNPVMLCLMTGGLVVAGHLLTRLPFPLSVDYVHVTRYHGQTQGGVLSWLVEPNTPLQGRSVVLVDDILDEGYTLDAIVQYCRSQGAEEVVSAVLVDKAHHRRKPGVQADYAGLQVGDRYVFGYGMDYKGYWRNAAGIYAVRDA